jgi:AcrR family transcriptional regulator
MLRCIVYTSIAAGPWTESDIAALAETSRLRNSANDITGRLLRIGVAFVQALEGPDAAVTALYAAIAADPRHTDVIQLINAPIESRAYGGWAMEVLSTDVLPAAEAQWAQNAIDHLRQPEFGDADFGTNVDTLLQKVGRSFTAMTMRTTPIQTRSLDTVRRIVTAGRRIALASNERPSLQAVADAANIQLAAVYRYFSSPDDLVRMIVRLWTVAVFDRYRNRLATVEFTSLAEVADHMTANLERFIRNGFNEARVSSRIKMLVMRDFHEVPYAEQWALAGDIVAAMARGGLDTSDPDIQARLALAFGSASGLVKMTMLHAPHLQGSVYFRTTLRGYFLAALSGEQPGAAGLTLPQ